MVVIDASMVSKDYIYKMGSGDKIKVTVYQEEDLSGEFEIDSWSYIKNGNFSLRGSYEHSTGDSSLSNMNYDRNLIKFGLKSKL